MWMNLIFGMSLIVSSLGFRLSAQEYSLNRRDANFGTFDPNALYQQQSQQTQAQLSQTNTQSGPSSSPGQSSSSSASSGSSGSSTSSGSFDPNVLYQQMSKQMQQYIDLHKPGTSSGGSSGFGSSSGSGSTAGSSSGGLSTSTGGSFDPNTLFQQMSQQSQQNLNSQNTDSKYDANTLNKLQASFTDPTQSQLGTSNGGGAGFDPDQYNTMKFNLFSPEQGGSQSSSQSGSASGSGTNP